MRTPLRHADVIALLLLAFAPHPAIATEPSLPAGLDGGTGQEEESPPRDRAPDLPPGLGDRDQEPMLPSGLGDDPEPASEEEEEGAERRPLFGLTGFWDLRAGPRLGEDPLQEELILGELRLQLSRSWYTDIATFTLTADLLYDAVADDRSLDLERGHGWIDLRQASVLVRPLDFADLEIGRQILTWGVGDLVFLNDQFPKDYVSFFAGRDVEYLKAPSDAVKLSLFGRAANLDLVYMPRFDPDRFLTGERLSLYNPLLGRRSGDDALLSPAVPDEWFADDEIAGRLYRQLGAFELAAYGYRGFWKSPRGVDPAGMLTFPALSVWGASLRGPAAGGIASAEIAYYDSREDRAGADPRLPNGQWRTLVGLERELLPELTLGVQYYTEITQDYGALRRALPAGSPAGEHVRHTLTVRLTRSAIKQRLVLGAFNFWSPNADDGHLRLEGRYELTDSWLLQGGLNLFYGVGEDGFFGQFEDDSHTYLAVRRSF